MFGRSIKLFTLFGFTVKLDVSWLIILALVVWSLAGAVFPQRYPGLGPWTHFAMGLGAAVGLFFSIVFHEMFHSLIARQFGLPMTGITLFLFGGVAEMSEEPPSPKAEFWMAIAGPISSVVLGGVLLGLAYAVGVTGAAEPAVAVLRWVAILNFILAAFNLIPGFPLDGGRVLRSIIWHLKGDLRKATHAASRVGAGFGMGLVGLGIAQILLLWNAVGGVWWILIGLFIRGAAKRGYQQVLMRQALTGEPVERFMRSDPVTVSPDLTLSELVEEYVYRHHYKMYPVVKDGELLGCVTTRNVQDVPRDEWSSKTVGDVAASCGGDNTVSPDTDAVDALAQMRREKVSRLIVRRDGQLAGVLTLKDLLEFLSLKLELEGEEKPNLPERPPNRAPELKE